MICIAFSHTNQTAPSQANIQQQLIAEELEEHSICGQTSCILCRLKIQEMQYVCIMQILFQSLNNP